MRLEQFLNLSEMEWDGESPIYSDINDTYYRDLDEAECDLEENQTLEDLQLLACKPEYIRPLDESYCEDILPEDGELPQEVLDAMNEFNQKVEGIIISWYPRMKRIKL
mgnify:CR=1 FL=1